MTAASDLRDLRPLLMSYGGGHGQIIASVAEELIARGAAPTIIGLTTAAQMFRSRGLPAGTVLDLAESASGADPDPGEAQIRSDIAPVIRNQSHGDISAAETACYFTIGFRDLVGELGRESALERLTAEGRKAFRPVASMKRYLERTRPDVVVATTSPRFELALLQAARLLDIPSLAISDLYLVRERDWILPGPYAHHLTVFSGAVKRDLLDAGLRDVEVHVTGNPAFDSLRPTPDDDARRADLRARLGVGDHTVVLWPAAQLGARGRSGEPYAGPSELTEAFERVCTADPAFTYILRPHPNSPFTLGPEAIHGRTGRELESIDDALLVADVVCVEVSTVGLQAALRGMPVICVKYAEDAVYPLHGLATVADDLDHMTRLLLDRAFDPPSAGLDIPELGTATANVADLIAEIARPNRAR